MGEIPLLPMLCQSADEVPVGDQWAAEPKLDGWRLLAEVRHTGVHVVAGRNGASYTGRLPYLEAELAQLPVGTIVDGELMGTSFEHVGSIMRSNVAHVPSDRNPALRLYLFDVLRFGPDDVRREPWEERRGMLEHLAELPDWKHIGLTLVMEANAASLALALGQGFEGVVCKRRDSTYIGSKSPKWIKVKPQETVDAKIVGFKPGKAGSRWKDGVGAFEVELEGSGVRTTVKCGTDARHIEASEHPERWLGVVIELAHHGLSRDGVPRHPQFHRRRDDKTTPRTRTVSNQEVTRSMSTTTGGPSGRNYGAMRDEKLLACIEQLRAGEGNAVDRVIAKGADVGADLAIAENVAIGRGLQVAA